MLAFSFFVLLACLLAVVRGDFVKLGNCAADESRAMRTVWDTGKLTLPGCFAKTPSYLLTCTGTCPLPKEGNVPVSSLVGQYVEFGTYLTFQDDSSGSLKAAALADLANPAAKRQLQYFVRRVVLGALNLEVGKHNDVVSTFIDCDPKAADVDALGSFVDLWYDDKKATLQLTFNVHVPRYWISATTVGIKPTDTGIQAPEGIQSSLDMQIFGNFICDSNKNSYKACKDDKARIMLDLQTIIDAATKLTGMADSSVVSKVVRALSPSLGSSLTTYLRSLLLKSGTQAKVVAAGATGKALTVKGP